MGISNLTWEYNLNLTQCGPEIANLIINQSL